MIFYIGEDFTLEFNAGVDITGGSAVIKYKGPTGITTSASATITNAAGGIFSLAVADTAITIPGKYKYWSVITFADGTKSISTPKEIWVLNEGDMP